MANEKSMRWIILIIIILITISMQNTIPKQAVADVEGRSCLIDEECPCWGKIEGTDIEAFGLGTSTCNAAGVCDTTFCFDVQPIGEFARDKPWQWLKDNPLMTIVIIALVILYITWPKL